MSNGLHWREIEKLREKVHSHGNMITEINGDIEGLPERVTALENMANRFLGMLAILALLGGILGNLLLQLFEK